MKYRHLNVVAQLNLAILLGLGASAAQAVTAVPDDAASVAEDFAPYNEALASRFSATNGPITDYSLVSNGGGVVTTSVDNVTGDVLISPVADANGVAVLVFSATDLDGTVNWQLTLTVDPINDAPDFTPGADQTVGEDSGAQVVAGWVAGFVAGPANESGQSAGAYNITGNSDPTLFAGGPVIDELTGDLSFTPAANVSGSATITVNVTDDGGMAGGGVDTGPDHTFDITVSEVNDAPSFVGSGDVSVAEDAGPQVVASWANTMSPGPAAEAAQTLSFNVAGNSNPGLFASQPTVDPTTGDLSFTAAADGSGVATITVNLADDGGTAGGGIDTSSDVTFDITVTDVNDAPSFVDGGDVNVAEDAGAQTIASWAKSISAGPAAESAQILSFNVTGNSNPGLFTSAPVVDPATGDLSFQAAADASGVATITVNLSDSGGTAGGGIDTSADVSFDIIVGEVNDAPSFVAGADQTVLEDVGAITVPGWATSLDTGSSGEAGQTLAFNIVSNSRPSLFAVPPAVDGVTGDLTYTPTADASGVATLRLVISDDGGTAGGGVDTSPIQAFQIDVTPVNDVPVFNPGPTVGVPEDAGPITYNNWATGISAGPADESGQNLTFLIVGNDNPGLFDTLPAIDASNGRLTFETVFDANGSANITIALQDDGGVANGGVDRTADVTFSISVSGVNDTPAPADDAVTIDEDSGPVMIQVLPNDYLGETPTTVTSAGSGGYSEGTPSIILDENNDPIGGQNGTVQVIGDEIQYEPKENFFGDDYFTYTITDAQGDIGTATVHVTVNPINDPPTAPALRNYSMLENSALNVDATDGLLFGAYDVEGALLDAGGNPVGSDLDIQINSFPLAGVLTLDNAEGTFQYTPPVDFTGEASFTYRVSDGTDQSALYEARIVVYEAPEPPAPPPAGEVAVTWNLANVPLEQSTSVAPNVIIMMDDSGSMDWHMSVRGADAQGGFVIDNDEKATSTERSTSYYYLWDLSNNIFGTTSANGRILPNEEELVEWGYADNHYGLWRARNHKYNRLYYNPEVQYTPWVGLDSSNNEFSDADPAAIRLNPRDPYNTFNMLNGHDYFSDNIPRWRTSGGIGDRTVDDMYIPFYYATTADEPLEWNDPHTKIEIRDTVGAVYPGGPTREDCAADDGNPLTCSYAQEIQNFANFFQYYRSREYAAKNGLGKVVSQLQDIRVGYETINDARSEDVQDMNDLYTEGNKKALMDEIYRTNSSGGTPLRRALDRAGDIFAGSHGTDPVLPEPEGLCQQNFTLLFSDGYWNGTDPSQGDEDGDNDSSFDGGVYADDEAQTLADVAMYFYERDLRGSMEDLVPVSQRDRVGAPSGTFDSGSARMHQHMKTYTVAFGVVGDVDPTMLPADPTVPFAWPDPEASSQGKIDDMLHAAVNGRGQFLSAVNPQELQTALESAFLEFTQAASSTSAAAFNSTSLQEGTLLYRGFYDLRDFTGELSATRVNSDGTLAATPEWLASEQLNPANKLPNSRVLITYDDLARQGLPFRHADLTPDQQLVMNSDEVNYVRGSRGMEQPSGALRRRPSTDGLLGDIVNSSPVFVGTPRGLNRDQAPYPEGDLYSDFVDLKAGRQPMVYVGANDGMLHGFDALTGEERVGYVPNKILDGSARFANKLDEFTSPFYQHKYFVDLSPRISDAYVRPSTGAGSRGWNTLLMGGLGAGGKGYFALNVTDPAGDFINEASAAGTVLWEFTDEDDTSPSAALDPFGAPVKDLGYAVSLPTVAMSNVGGGTENEWVAIFGNGPNSTAGIAKLFVLFPDRGLDGWDPGDFVKLDTGYGVPIAPDQLAGFPNGLGTPTLVDTDLNGTVDWVYAGDRLGNLYRFDLCHRDPTTHLCSGDTDDWTVTRLFTATYFDGTVDRLQPILSQPLVIKHPDQDGFLVIFGTGSYLSREDADSEEIQSIYAIWDRGSSSPPTALANSKAVRLVEQTLTNEVDDSVSPAMTRRVLTKNPVNYELESGVPGTFGWYVDLDMPRATSTLSGAANTDASGRNPPDPQFPGEKAIRRLLLRNGAVITTTVLPSLDEFSCYGTRPGAILLLDAVTGGDVDRPVIDFNRDGVIDEGDLLDVDGENYAAGLLFNQSDLDGALVDLSTLGGEGDTDWLFACGGNDCVPFQIEPPSDTRTGRLSWRELDNE